MGDKHRTCETCVYCSFAGNCDHFDRPLVNIEMPACDDYEIHPLLAENDKLKNENEQLRELVADINYCSRTNHCSRCYFLSGKCDFADRMNELGVKTKGDK